jgi:hypothetical protein
MGNGLAPWNVDHEVPDIPKRLISLYTVHRLHRSVLAHSGHCLGSRRGMDDFSSAGHMDRTI